VKGLRLDSSAASCASYDTQLHQHTRSLISEHKSSTVPVQARDSLLTLACSGNLWGCDTWKPHCKQWAQAERSYYKEVAQNEMVLILHERLAVIKSSCRNMLSTSQSECQGDIKLQGRAGSRNHFGNAVQNFLSMPILHVSLIAYSWTPKHPYLRPPA